MNYPIILALNLTKNPQNRGFCAFLGSGTPVFGCFEHKIGIFVRFCPSEPPFSSISSTKSRFLCFFGVWNPHFQAFRAQNRGFCAQEEGKVGSESVTAETLTTLPPHLRRRTSAPAHQHPHTSSSAPAPAYRHQRTRLATAPSNGTRHRQVPSGAV